MPSFFDRLFGRRGHVRTGSARGEDDREPDGPRGDRRYLEFVGGNSAKFYAVVLHGDDDDGWTVSFNFGRIGHPRDWATKIEETDEDEAREAFDAVLDEKLRGGYQPRAWPASLTMPDTAARECPTRWTTPTVVRARTPVRAQTPDPRATAPLPPGRFHQPTEGWSPTSRSQPAS